MVVPSMGTPTEVLPPKSPAQPLQSHQAILFQPKDAQVGKHVIPRLPILKLGIHGLLQPLWLLSHLQLPQSLVSLVDGL